MFQKATRQKLRFDSARGPLTVEDLWDLPLTSTVSNKLNLDDIARALHAQLNNGSNVSFVVKEHKSNELVQLKFDVVKAIIEARLAEDEAAATMRDRKERKQTLLAILAEQEASELRNKTPAEIRKMLESL